MDAPTNNDDSLAANVSDMIATGRLPDRPPDRLWGGPGTEATCGVCGGTIAPSGTEFELEFAGGNGSASGAVYHLHDRCFTAWEAQRRQRANAAAPAWRSGA